MNISIKKLLKCAVEIISGFIVGYIFFINILHILVPQLNDKKNNYLVPIIYLIGVMCDLFIRYLFQKNKIFKNFEKTFMLKIHLVNRFLIYLCIQLLIYILVTHINIMMVFTCGLIINLFVIDIIPYIIRKYGFKGLIGILIGISLTIF